MEPACGWSGHWFRGFFSAVHGFLCFQSFFLARQGNREQTNRRPQAMKVQRRFKNMNIFGRAAGFSRPRLGKPDLISLLSLALLFATWPQKLSASQDAQAPHRRARRRRARRRRPTRNRLPNSCSSWSRRLRCIRIRWWRRFWRRPRFPSKSSRPTDGCKRILI